MMRVCLGENVTGVCLYKLENVTGMHFFLSISRVYASV